MDERQESRRGEINLIDIVFFCLERWRGIIVCMLIFAVVAGFYKYQDAMKSNQLIQNNASSEKSDNRENKEQDSKERAIEVYEQAIKETEYDLEIKENYLNDSVVMQMDPYHVSRGTLTYYVAEGEQKTGVLAAYRAFVTGGGMADKLYVSDDDISVEDLQYLISFTDSSSREYEIDSQNRVMFSTEAATSVFQIQIRMPSSEIGESYMNRAEEVIADYASQVQLEVGSHKINLLSSVQSEIADTQLQEYQSTMRAAYTTSARSLQALRTELNTIQTTVNTQESTTTVQATVNAKSSAIKFAVLGMVLGAGIACFILLISYLLGGRLQDTEDFHAEFGMPLLGMVHISGTRKRIFGFIDTLIFRLRGGVCSKISFEEQIKVAAANIQAAIPQGSSEGGLRKVMIAGTVDEKEVSDLCVRMASEVDGISLSPYMQIIFQSTALKELENYDGILFVEKKGFSNCRFIEQEKELAVDRGIKVLGTIVLC